MPGLVHVRRNLALLLVLFAWGPAARAQVIPAARDFSAGWRNAGIPGEIPAPNRIVNVKSYGAVGDGVNNDAPSITAAISALSGKGGVVYFPAGTYAVPNDVIRLSSNVVLRGERSFNTEIIATNLISTQTAVISMFGSDPGTPWIDIAAGYDVHSQTISLTNVATIAAGDWIETHEGVDPAWGLSAWPDFIGQIVRVINVATTTPPAGILTLASPLRLQYQPGLPLGGASINPQVRKFHRAIQNAGVENLRVSRRIAGDATMRNNVPSVYFRFAINCWVRGCEFTNIFGSACSADYSANCEITGNYMHHAYEFDGGGSGYGTVFQYRCSEFLVENNIFKRLRHSMVIQAGVNGNVFGYNYSEESPAFLSDMTGHGNFAYANLFEGNCGMYLHLDSSHGANGPHNTYFRNRARGVIGQAMAITDTKGTNQTFVGNEGVGTYSIAKTGTFEYGNNDDGTIKPTGTAALPDYSYYLGTNAATVPPVPSWWNIPGFIPTYGPLADGTVPPVGTERDIPARVRWNAGGARTYGPPSIGAQPTNATVNSGQAATMSVLATGTPVALFQWYKGAEPVAGGTGAVLTLAPATVGDAGVYRALVSDSNGAMWSANATLVVNQVNVQLVTAGSPHRWGTPLPFGYGTNSVPAPTLLTNRVDSPIDSGPGTRQVCTGWVGSGSIPATGSSNTLVAVVASPSSLTWLWTTQFRLDAQGAGGGSASGGGWYGTGTVAAVTATPAPAHLFVEWTGDVPAQDRYANPLSLVMDRPRAVRAHFTAAATRGAMTVVR